MSTLEWKSGADQWSEAYWKLKGFNYVMLKAEIGNATYRADNLIGYGEVSDRNRCRVEVVGSRGGKRELNLGCYKTMQEAKNACEDHWYSGCDMTRAAVVYQGRRR